MSETLKGHKIGFIGLGNMGWPMSRHLHEAGADLCVWNRSEGPARRAAEAGMTVATDPEALASAVGGGILCLNLTHTTVVRSVLDTFIDALEEGALVIDFGTTGYPGTREFSERVAEVGAEWLDAPVSGGQVAAEQGTLSIFCGGSKEALDRARPLFETVGKNISHLGEVGAGQVTKMANQLIVAQTIDAVAQALRLAEVAGLDSGRVRDALRGGFAESRILELHGDRMVRRDFEPGGKSEFQLKDVRLLCELAETVGFESSTLSNSLDQWVRFVEELGHGELDHSGLIRLYEEEAT